MDFTIKKYRQLLKAFLNADYRILTYEKYCTEKPSGGKFLILRHDVDEIAGNALKMAEVEYQLGIHATYYFRIVSQSDKPEIIKQIAQMGHEIGYHYEDLAFAEGDLKKAKETFTKNLTYFRTYYPVKTVCMHGSSTSKYDNRDFWEAYDLDIFDLIGEPYLTTDFTQIFYITDTGNAWDGGKYAVRDTVKNHFGISYHSSDDIIGALKAGTYPSRSLMLAHTLWSPNKLQWVLIRIREFLRNNLKYMAQRNRFLKKLYSRLVKAYWKK